MIKQMLIASAVMGVAETGVEVTQGACQKWLQDRGQNIDDGVIKMFFENFSSNLYSSFQLIVLTRVIRQADSMIEPFELDLQKKMDRFDRIFGKAFDTIAKKRGGKIAKARGLMNKIGLKKDDRANLVEEAKLNAEVHKAGSLMTVGMSTGAGSVVAKTKGTVPSIPSSNEAFVKAVDEFVNASKMG